jgi:hypothetical protein
MPGTYSGRPASADLDKGVYSLRNLQRKNHPGSTISKQDIDNLIEQGSVASLQAGINAGRFASFAAAELLGVGGLGLQRVKGDMYVSFTVNGEVVKEVGVKKGAKLEGQLRAWVLVFNDASRPSRQADVPAPAEVSVPVSDDIPAQLVKLHGLHAAGILTDGEYQNKRTALVEKL